VKEFLKKIMEKKSKEIWKKIVTFWVVFSMNLYFGKKKKFEKMLI